MIIYIDIFFIKNMIFNFLLLCLTSLMIKRKIKIWKAIIGACIGGIYAVLALYYQEIFNSGIIKICVSFFMLLITFGKKEITVMLSSFFVLSYLIAGIIASILSVNSQIIILLFGISMIIIFHIYKKNKNYEDYTEINVEIFEKNFNLVAKIDTGNELSDTLFGDPVIVLSENRAKKEFENELIQVLNNERLNIPSKYKNRIKLISFKTISGEGIKIGIKVDKVIVYLKDKILESKAIIILSERKFKGYDALIGKKLLERGYEYESISFNKIKNQGIV